MTTKKYTEEFKIEAVKQITENGYSVKSVSERLGVSDNSLYNWMKRYGKNSQQYQENNEQALKIKALEKELKRVTMERDILKEAAVYFAAESKKGTRS